MNFFIQINTLFQQAIEGYELLVVVMLAFGLLILIPTFYAWSSLAPWLPTRKRDLEKINALANLQPGQIFLELGSGNTRVCRYIAERNPKAKVIGIELAYPFYLYTKIHSYIFGPKNMEIVFGNAFEYNLSKIDVIYVFGLPTSINKQLKYQLNYSMKSSACLISYAFKLDDWSGTTTIHPAENNGGTVYVYEK